MCCQDEVNFITDAKEEPKQESSSFVGPRMGYALANVTKTGQTPG